MKLFIWWAGNAFSNKSQHCFDDHIPWSRYKQHRGRWQWLRKAEICCTSWERLAQHNSVLVVSLHRLSILWCRQDTERRALDKMGRMGRQVKPNRSLSRRRNIRCLCCVQQRFSKTQNCFFLFFGGTSAMVEPRPCFDLSPLEFKSNLPSCSAGKLHQHFPKDIALLRIKFEFTALNIRGTLQRQIKMSKIIRHYFFELWTITTKTETNYINQI